jgi:Tfp pilus assembly protein PilN
MAIWLLDAAQVLALALQSAIPARLRGLDRVREADLDSVGPGRAVQLILPEESLLQQRLDLPKGETAPGPVWLAARVEALSPWDRDACLWDARVAGGAVHLALIPLRRVTVAEAALTAQGGRLAEVVGAGFCFRRDRVQTRRWRDRLALGIGLGTILALALAALGVQMALQAQDRTLVAEAALDRSAARLKECAGPAQAALALVPRKAASVALALTHLAAALPQDSYLTTLSVNADGFELTGQTAAPEAIIPALSADPTFAEVDFAGPAARNPDTGSYSFTIRGKLVTPALVMPVQVTPVQVAP